MTAFLAETRHAARLGGEPGAGAAPSAWKGLFGAGGFAALTTVATVPIVIAAFVAAPPPAWVPGAAGEWFELLQRNALLGLVGLDLLLMVSLVLGIPVFLALYVALSRAGRSTMAIATAAGLVATVLHLASNTAFEMLSLSQGYGNAATEAQRAVFLAAGEASLASYYGSAFHVGYVLGYLARAAIGLVMLRSAVFGKPTACVGILAGATGLGFYLPVVGLTMSILSVVFVAAWNLLIGRRLLQLARSEGQVPIG
jgi:hypothetical protein